MGDNLKDIRNRHRRPCPQPSGQLGSSQPCVGECRELVCNTINPKSTLKLMTEFYMWILSVPNMLYYP